MNKPDLNTKFYARIVNLLQAARENVIRAVNHTMVITYFEIGKMIVEEEQNGGTRADYGKSLIRDLSNKLTREFGKGFSATNLKQMRQFYLVYSIGQTPSDESERVLQNTSSNQFIAESPHSKFNLSWSHYLTLMRVENVNERKFYEIECSNNNSSVRELQRQIDSELYARLVLSRDKNKVKELSEKGLIIEQPKDSIKDPYILEFLGLPELSTFTETELEERIISKLEHFLLELGNGFTFAGRQVRFTFDEEHFRVDLVFYNRILKC